ncbi:ImmA/IrrE family metallo-endopeptidase [Leptospira santarosai]|uniref:ImmA/IrrE family metallo-endopeptidase n=1 Tax=Leptospira santarosai TaxID=28183 RepID=UPI0024AF6A8B|nr:ImmA/IrrE family metallo-endopeptidase [Leptospira santarosai]MDI7165970.1 ImmA/IrrE family metallo-endopeptidase [Leptospira santarosai]
MNDLRRKEINAKADELRMFLELKVPLDLVQSVEKLGGRVFEDENLPFEALIKKDEKSNKFEIRLQGNHSEVRKRFSIAHEIAHLILHMNYDYKNHSWLGETEYKDSVLYRYGFTKEEYEANEFAAAFLMPAEEFKLISDKNYHSESEIYKIKPIAEYFKVSMDAVKNRGRWLQIFAWD